MKKGFTLIELLVVVLIIGILSAIALPKYQMAVERSRAMQAVILIKAWADAQERYFMANGMYSVPATDALRHFYNPQDGLDIDFAVPKGWEFFSSNDTYMAARNSKIRYNISKTFTHGKQSTDEWRKRKITCHADIGDEDALAGKICKSLCGTSTLTQVWASGEMGCEMK